MNAGIRLCASTVLYQTELQHLESLAHSLMAAYRKGRQSYAINLTFVVVVNDSEVGSDGTYLRLVERCLERHRCQKFIDIVVLSGHGNIGYGSAQNLALEAGSFDYHLILNPDIELHSNAIEKSLDYMLKNSECVMVAPQGYDSRGRYAYLAKRSPNLLVLMLRGLAIEPSDRCLGRIVSHYVYGDRLPADSPKSVQHASGCFMFCRADTLRMVGGFDERFFLYFEDYDLSVRVRNYGEIVELPDVRVVHHGGQAARKGLRRIHAFVLSAITYFRIHGWRLA